LLSGFEVSGLNKENFLDLAEVYTQRTMPVSRNNILTQQDLEGWKYLKGIKVPSLEAEVELLIGINTLKLIEPWEIINSQGEEPYAVRTLGWVVNGPLRDGEPRKGKFFRPAVTANRISVAKLQDLLVAQYNQDFNDKLEEWPKTIIDQPLIPVDNHEVKKDPLVFSKTLQILIS
jgi:hypothetical protein